MSAPLKNSACSATTSGSRLTAAGSILVRWALVSSLDLRSVFSSTSSSSSSSLSRTIAGSRSMLAMEGRGPPIASPAAPAATTHSQTPRMRVPHTHSGSFSQVVQPTVTRERRISPPRFAKTEWEKLACRAIGDPAQHRIPMTVQNETARRRSIGFLNWAHFLDHYVILILPTVVIGLEAVYGRSYGDLLVLSTAAFTAFGLFALPAGWLANNWNRRKMIAIFFFGTGICCVLVGVSDSFETLAIALFGVGLFAAIYHPV